MLIYILDGFVCCSLENKNTPFLKDCKGLFDGYKGNSLFISKYNEAKEAWAYKEVGMENDLAALDRLIENAEKHGIEVEKGVFDLRDKLSTIVADAAKKRRQREEEKQAKELWQKVCKHGCKGCDKLYYIDGEIPCCGYSGDLLEERMEGTWSSNMKVFHHFVYNPYPSEGCKYKVE